MNWTDTERELIAILDQFLKDCEQTENLQSTNYYPLITEILAATKGEIKATKKYCEAIIKGKDISREQKASNFAQFAVSDSSPFSQTKIALHQPTKKFSQSKQQYSQKFKSFWTILFLFLTASTIFFAAKKSPNLSSVKTFPNVAILCPASLIETAQSAIKKREEFLLAKAIADLQSLKDQQADRLGSECEQILWETQFVYAIDFLASKGKREQAVKNLCQISAKYYQTKDVIPWFTRWSNTNANFRQWLAQYKVNNSCTVAPYLE